MTDTNNNNDDIRALLLELTRSQLQTQEQIRQTQQEIRATQESIRETTATVQELTSDINRVLARSAVFDDVVLQLQSNQQLMQANFNGFQQNFAQHQRTLEEYRGNFIEHQRTTNAALNSLEAINLRLIEIIGRGQN
jgi:septal ring factor EnvC (AmiA/AmiB activator)